MAEPGSDLFIGISGGHTRSSAVVFDINQGPLAVAEGPRINAHTDSPGEAADNFVNLLLKIENEKNLPDLVQQARRISLVCAGAAFKEDQIRIKEAIIEAFKERATQIDVGLTVADDTWAGLLAGRFSYHGVCAFAGTGASVFVGDGTPPEGLIRKIDGWGPIIGDFGSGFQLSVDLFRELGREEERSQKVPELFFKLQEFINRPREEGMYYSPLEDFDGIQEWFDVHVATHDRGWRIRFAQLAEVVTTAADAQQPDTMAEKLIRKSANEIAESIELALHRFPESSGMPIVFQGGMFEHSALYRRIVTDRLATTAPTRVTALAKYCPVVGSAIIAYCGFGHAPTAAESRTLVDIIEGFSGKDREVPIRNVPEACGPLFNP